MKCQKSGCGIAIELRKVDGDPIYMHIGGEVKGHSAQVKLQKAPK